MGVYDIDYTKKENQTFKKWFKIMLVSGYLPLFIIGIIATIGLASTDLENKNDYFILLVPIAVVFVTGYMGLYKYWDRLKNGR